MRRTFPEENLNKNEKFLEKLKNILICYSIRNTTVGYCQGMNFIGGRILLIMENEEQQSQLTQKEIETLDKIIEKLLSVKKYLYLYI